MVNRERIARKVAQDIADGDVVNFGHGIPYSVPRYIDPQKKIYFHNECGLIGFGLGPPADAHEFDLLDTSNSFVSSLPGGAYLSDISASFSMIRGGHINKTILGALQVDEKANIANWRITGLPATGIGGAMDLCAGCGQVYVAMESMTKDGKSRLLRNCDYPLTAIGKVSKVYTEFGVIDLDANLGFVLTEVFPDYTLDQIKSNVEATLHISNDLKTIDLGVEIG